MKPHLAVQRALALPAFPLFRANQAHWGIHGEGTRREVDNAPPTGVARYWFDTIHRVGVR